MKKQIFKGLFMITVLSVGMWACKKDVDNTTNSATTDVTTEYKIKSPQEINEARIYFAKTLSKAIVNTEFREYIHEKMKLRYTTDYEFVWIAEKDKKLKSGKKVSAILAEYADEKLTNKYGSNFFNDVITIDPLIAISFPERETINIENWNVNTIPDAAAIMDRGDISKGEFMIFDKTGNAKLDSRNGEPTAATLIVWEAESYYLIDKRGITTKGIHIREHMPKAPSILTGRNDCDAILEQAYAAMDQYEMGGGSFYLTQHNQLLNQYNQCIGAGTGSGNNPPTCTQPCQRDCIVNDEVMDWYKVNGWQGYQVFSGPFWETSYIFHCKATFLNVLPNGQFSPVEATHVTTSWSKGDLLSCSPSPCVGKTKSANGFRIMNDWVKNARSENINFQWVEVDNITIEPTFKIAPKFKVLGVEISIFEFGFKISNDPIVDLGSQNAFYCDQIEREYNTGPLTFKLKK
jgi:hypothetical protein